MKKKQKHPSSNTLLVLCSASLGGPTSSAINLLRLFKERGECFDVFLMDHEGSRTIEMAEQGNLIEKIPMLADAITDRKNLKTPAQYLRRICFVVSHKILGISRARDLLFKRAARRLGGKYQNIIAYQESMTSEFARFIDAPNRIAWMHTDFDKLRELSPFYASNEIYDYYHHIASVTKSSAERMIEVLGRNPSTVHVIRNPLIPEQIIERSKEAVPQNEQKKKAFLFVSVGRLSEEKAFDRIPRIAKILLNENCDFDWYIIGDGATRRKIEAEIERTGTGQVVHMMGARMNPYPLIGIADALVITSVYEAQPMVANEALILGKPVISTEFASVREVIKDGENGIIVPQSEDALAQAMYEIIRNDDKRERMGCEVKNFKYSNDKEITLVDSLISNNKPECRSKHEN